MKTETWVKAGNRAGKTSGMNKDDLGDRIKSQYENRTRYMLPRRTFTVIRLDGKAFHSYTRTFKKPFDQDFMQEMLNVTAYLLEEIQGAKIAYRQSDEISLILTDFDDIKTDAWFDGNVQKMCSVASSMCTAYFNRHHSRSELAFFDARVFTIPDKSEVVNYLVWRTKDAIRNSVQMFARSLYSHGELQNKGVSELHDMIHAKGFNWNNLSNAEKNGDLILKGRGVKDIPVSNLYEFYSSVLDEVLEMKGKMI